jgi:hypothetical protein
MELDVINMDLDKEINKFIDDIKKVYPDGLTHKDIDTITEWVGNGLTDLLCKEED